jgi:hypothetical protein
MNKPERTSTEHVLHFTDLSPRDFERLCIWLLKEEGFEKVDHIGASGSDSGCDISATKDGKCWIFQCKRVEKFGPKAAEKEVSKILHLPQEKRPDFILFIVTCDISKKTREIVRKIAGKISCEFWSLTILDERVKSHQIILEEFFHLNKQLSNHAINKYGFPINDYLNAIDTIVAREKIQEHCVPLHGEYECDERIEIDNVWNFILKWVNNKNNDHLAILGDYGTGKTWLCLRLTKELADYFRNDSQLNPLPILINFKSFKKRMNINELIEITMSRDYGILTCDTYKIQQVLNDHKAILIIDGLDEMVREIGNRNAFVQFSSLGLPFNAKVIITCRTHYFLSGTEQREILNRDLPIIPLNGVVKFDILHLKLFSKTSMEEAIRCRANSNDEERIIDFIQSTYNLQELCARPVLLSLVCQSFEAIKNITGNVTSADLYESYLKAWLNRELHSGHLDISPEDLLRLLEIIAEHLIRQNSLWLSSVDFNKILKQYIIDYGLNEIDKNKFVRQLATCTFLKRSKSDGWEFAHRSFQEYLYAKRFFRWEKETNGLGNFPVMHVPTWQFISQIVKGEWNKEKAEKWIVKQISWKKDVTLCKTTLRAAAAFWLLQCGRDSIKDYDFRGIMLDHVDLKGVNFYGVDLTGSDFCSSDLRGAKLSGVILRKSFLVSANFSGADLSNSDLRKSNYHRATFEGADLSNVKWSNCFIQLIDYLRTKYELKLHNK